MTTAYRRPEGRAWRAYRRPEGRAWRAYRAYVLAAKGDECHLCHHRGARQLDHIVSRLERPDLAWEFTNLAPAHGTRNRCPECGRCCNQSRRSGPKRPTGAAGPVKPELTLVSRTARKPATVTPLPPLTLEQIADELGQREHHEHCRCYERAATGNMPSRCW